MHERIPCRIAHSTRPIRNATTEEEGKDDFRYDIKQMEHDMNVVFAAGWERVKYIMPFGGFPRITGINNESDQYDASSSMLVCLPVEDAVRKHHAARACFSSTCGLRGEACTDGATSTLARDGFE